MIVIGSKTLSSWGFQGEAEGGCTMRIGFGVEELGLRNPKP